MLTDTPTAPPAAATPTPLQDVLDDLELFDGKTGIYKTCWHLARKIPEGISQLDIQEPLRSWCAYNELDYDVYIVQTCNILDEGLELHAPIHDTINLLDRSTFRVTLPDDMVHTDDLSTLATACFHLDDLMNGERFHLSNRKAGYILGKSHETARQCLKKLMHHNVIAEGIKGQLSGRLASVWSYISESKRDNLTQETQETQETQKKKPRSSTPPPPDRDGTSGLHDIVEPSKNSDADDLDKIAGSLQVAEALGGGGGVVSLFPKPHTATATASLKEKSKSKNGLFSPDRNDHTFALARPTTQKPCGICGVQPWDHKTPDDPADDPRPCIDACFEARKARNAPPAPMTPFTISERCKAELKSSDRKEYAAIIARYFKTVPADITSKIKGYVPGVVIKVVCEILKDRKVDRPASVLSYRLKIA